MNRQEIIDTVNEALISEFEVEKEKMTPQSKLIDDLDLDSLDFVDMVVIFRQRFGIELRNEPRVRELRTLENLYDLVEDLVKKQPG